MRIYVGNLPFGVTDGDLSAAFSQHGQVASAQVVVDRETGRSRGFGFVEMPTGSEAEAAIRGLNGKDMQGRALTVNEAKARYYQRLLARDQDEAAEIVEAYVNADGRESVYDAVLLPALYYAKQDRDRGLLSEGDAQFMGQATREILDVLAHDAPAPSERDTGDLSVSDPGADTRVRIVGCPARDDADALALEMVRHLLDPARYQMEVGRTGMLTAEVVASIDLHRPALLCIGAVAPGGLSQTRHLCKRLRSQYPELKIVVGRWGLHDEKDADRQQLLAAGADHVETTVLDTQRTLVQVGLTGGHPAPESPPTPAPEVVGAHV
jgi:hypothetical protein